MRFLIVRLRKLSGEKIFSYGMVNAADSIVRIVRFRNANCSWQNPRRSLSAFVGDRCRTNVWGGEATPAEPKSQGQSDQDCLRCPRLGEIRNQLRREATSDDIEEQFGC